MATGRRTGAASISEGRRNLRIGSILRVLGAVLLCLLAIGARPVAAAEVYVQQDATPLVSKPGIGGRILTWVDTGFPLVVIGIEGEWLKVASPRLKLPGPDLWVPLARVGQSVPGQIDIAFRTETPPARAFGTGFRLRAEGTPDTRFRARCLVVNDGSDSFLAFVDHVPADLNLGGDSVDCVISQLSRAGRMHVVLLRGDGATIASTAPIGLHQSARLRSRGRWGQAAGFQGPAGGSFEHTVFFRRPLSNGFIPPIENAVPPLGSPVPFIGNPVAPLGNPVPAIGNPVPSFARSPLPIQ
jgi:hypothetical protein